jgi:hypothetical protein
MFRSDIPRNKGTLIVTKMREGEEKMGRRRKNRRSLMKSEWGKEGKTVFC